MNIRPCFLLVIVLLIIGHTRVFALPSYAPETPLESNEMETQLLVYCGIPPEFNPVTVAGLLPDSPCAETNPAQQGAPVPLSHAQSPAPVPEASTVLLVCVGLFAIWRVKTSLHTR